MGLGISIATLLPEVNAMLDTSTPDLTDALRLLSQHRPLGPPQGEVRRPPRKRRMRARRTAAIMVGFGIVLGGVELLILLSYL
jgi:hypothetical protein